MNKLQIGLGLAALLAGNALSTSADAAQWYAKATVGQTDAEVSGIALEEAATGGLEVGTHVGPVRVEAGVARLHGTFAGIVDADALDYHADAYLDLPLGDNATLFGGAGLDYVDGEATVFGSSLDASGQGWSYMGGLSYRVSERITGEVQYRHLYADLDTDFGGSVDLDVDEVTVGVRFAL